MLINFAFYSKIQLKIGTEKRKKWKKKINRVSMKYRWFFFFAPRVFARPLHDADIMRPNTNGQREPPEYSWYPSGLVCAWFVERIRKKICFLIAYNFARLNLNGVLHSYCRIVFRESIRPELLILILNIFIVQWLKVFSIKMFGAVPSHSFSPPSLGQTLLISFFMSTTYETLIHVRLPIYYVPADSAPFDVQSIPTINRL